MAVLKSKKFIKLLTLKKKKINQYAKNTALFRYTRSQPQYCRWVLKFVYSLISFINVFDTLAIAIMYIFFYNIALIVIFWVLLSSQLSTLLMTSSLKYFANSTLHILPLSVSLFSMAGVPPFAGFFSKLLLVAFLTNSNLSILYVFLFIILFISLFFYMQNVRYLFIPSYFNATSTVSRPNQQSPYVVSFILFLTFGLLATGFIIDDILLFINLLLSV
jgi:NADH:ubiquinone oxidoreductase subunit 2 (subunit N)